MSEALLAALVAVALIVSVALERKWFGPKRYRSRKNESPLSWRRPVDVLILLVALVALLGGFLWLAGWELAV